MDTIGDRTQLGEEQVLATRRSNTHLEPSERVSVDKASFLTWEDMARETEDVAWLWDHWLPIGMVTLLVGEPGIGKSGLALAIVASVIRADPWPDGTAAPTPGRVVWVETEEGQQINLGRAKAWRLPLERILIPSNEAVFPDGRLDREDTWPSLEGAATQEDVRLVVVDSLRGAHRKDENCSLMVDLLTRLTALARDLQVAVLVIHHLRKRQVQDPTGRVSLDRVRGSTGIAQTPRVIWAVDQPDSSGEDLVRLYQIKSNLAHFPDELGFQITDKGLKYSSAPEAPRCLSPRAVAKEFLLRLLAGGPVRSSEVTDKAEAEGIKKSTLQRAKKELPITSVRTNGKWWWRLVGAEQETAI